MADQKSRGGQKQSLEKQDQGKKNRDVHGTSGRHGQRNMAEDARRGGQGNQGGYRTSEKVRK
ncbi:MAG TPA: hypothetical protein VKU02_07340 [Gemmataceae bacterium]|nr:hypothetical protein [Gemmataceae bacterium]